mgnify:CR=1 FL=1
MIYRTPEHDITTTDWSAAQYCDDQLGQVGDGIRFSLSFNNSITNFKITNELFEFMMVTVIEFKKTRRETRLDQMIHHEPTVIMMAESGSMVIRTDQRIIGLMAQEVDIIIDWITNYDQESSLLQVMNGERNTMTIN